MTKRKHKTTVKHMTAKGELVDEIMFLVVVRQDVPSPYSRPFLVRANSIWHAYQKVVSENEGVFQHPRVSLEGYVLGIEELPEAKMIARSWWLLAGKSAKDFEDEWREHGAVEEEVDE